MTDPLSVQAVIFDWAGTVIDFGSRAPMGAFVRAFAKFDVPITIADARGPMGMAKRDHIAALCAAPHIAAAWQAAHGRAPNDADIDAILAVFEPMNVASVRDHADFVPGALLTLADLRARGLRVGSTTGYTRPIMDVLQPLAASAGFRPEIVVCAGDLPAGRPSPLMMWHAMAQLGAWPAWRVVKVDDTVPGIGEGLAAGCWAIGVALTGNACGLSPEEFSALSPEALAATRARATAELATARPHMVIDGIADLPAALDAINARLARGERP